MYDNPRYNVILSHSEGQTTTAVAWSVPATASMYATTGRTSVFRVRDRCVILGVSVVGASGGSVGGTVSLKIARLVLGGAESLMTGKSIMASLTSSFLGNLEHIDCSLNPITLESFGDVVYLTAESSTLADKCANLSNITWRYRLLPPASGALDISHDTQQQ